MKIWTYPITHIVLYDNRFTTEDVPLLVVQCLCNSTRPQLTEDISYQNCKTRPVSPWTGRAYRPHRILLGKKVELATLHTHRTEETINFPNLSIIPSHQRLPQQQSLLIVQNYPQP